MGERRNGMLAAIGAYVVWGLLPIYWKLITRVPAGEILGHRVVWLLAVMVLLLAVRGQWRWVRGLRAWRTTLIPYAGTAALLGLNWFTYIWAINNERIVETSLGYFINPLVNVLLGVLFLRERLRPGQWMAIGLALVGVLYLTLNYGRLPWIAVILALTFGFYGLIRKRAALDAIEGSTVEAVLMFAPALYFLLHLERTGAGTFGHASISVNALLVMAGLMTATPLLLFNYGAHRIPLSSIGILQYISPTLQFLLGVVAYHEPFTHASVVGFSVIWAALLLYTLEGIVTRRRRQQLLSVA